MPRSLWGKRFSPLTGESPTRKEVAQTMSHSHNDRPFCGGVCRIRTIPSRSRVGGTTRQVDAQVLLIDPATGKPYTRGAIDQALAARAQEYPALAASARLLAEPISKRRAEAPYIRSIRGSDKAEALRRAEKELLPQLEPLAKILYRPSWAANVKSGCITVQSFVQYLGDDLYLAEPNENARAQIRAAVHSVLLPAVGSMTIAALADSDGRAKAFKAINRQLNTDRKQSSSRSYAKRACRLLLEMLQQYGAAIPGSPERICQAIDAKKRRNPALLSHLAPNHLDLAQRDRFFSYLIQNSMTLVLFWVMCIYSGLTFAEIAAAKHGDLRVLTCVDCTVYTYLVSKYRRKTNARWSTISVTNKESDFRKFRNAVFVPWAKPILQQLYYEFRQQGLADPEIAQLSFSADAAGKACTPDEMRSRVDAALAAAGLGQPRTLQRTANNGSVSCSAGQPDSVLLRNDAIYNACELCGLNIAMLHASFRLTKTETDETDYLDLLCDAFAVARYQRLRRFIPAPFAHTFAAAHAGRQPNTLYEPGYASYRLSVCNPTDAPQRLVLHSDYGVEAEW